MIQVIINPLLRCKVCKENFSSQDKLRQHEATHLIKEITQIILIKTF